MSSQAAQESLSVVDPKETLGAMRALLFVMAALLWRPSAAQAQEIDLSWHTEGDCPDRAWVLERVHHPSHATSPLIATAVIRNDNGSYQLDLTTQQAESMGRRRLTAANCAELAEVTAALLSLALGEHSPEPEAPAPPRKEPSEGSLKAPQAVSLWGLLGGQVTTGALPHVSGGPAISLALEARPLRFEAGAHGLAARRAKITDDVFAKVGLISGSAAFCSIQGRGFVFGACLGFQVGALRGVGRGVDDERARTDLWLAPHAAAHLEVRVHSVSVSLRPGIGQPIIRPRYTIEPYGFAFQPKTTFGSLNLALGYRFY